MANKVSAFPKATLEAEHAPKLRLVAGLNDHFRNEFLSARRRVLVADDQPRMLEAAAGILEKSFDVVDLVSDGQSALEATLRLEPDVVVLDISMPGMSGIDVARELKQLRHSTRIVFLTIHDDALISVSCLAAGGLGYVVKEFMDSDLIPAMHEALAGRVFVSRFSTAEISLRDEQ